MEDCIAETLSLSTIIYLIHRSVWPSVFDYVALRMFRVFCVSSVESFKKIPPTWNHIPRWLKMQDVAVLI